MFGSVKRALICKLVGGSTFPVCSHNALHVAFCVWYLLRQTQGESHSVSLIKFGVVIVIVDLSFLSCLPFCFDIFFIGTVAWNYHLFQ